jgi:hypothetical protein
MGVPEFDSSETLVLFVFQIFPEEPTAMKVGFCIPPPVYPLAGEMGVPLLDSSEIAFPLLLQIHAFPAASIAIPELLLIPPPVKPPAGERTVPELESFVTPADETEFDTQTLSELSIAML